MISSGIRSKERCSGDKHPPFIPLPHQQLILDYFPSSPYKGLLLYHKLGSGKTCTSILVADKMLKNRQIKRVFVLTPGSLRLNWLDEYCRKCGLKSKYLTKYFTFITYNYNIFNGITALDFNDSLVIIDEAHNLINGAKNMSKNPLSLYNKIVNSNARVLVLTATVIFNNVYEWCLLSNLLKEGVCPNIIEGDILRSELYDPELLTKENLRGIISFFPGSLDDYPEVIYHDPILIKMNRKQEIYYRDQDRLEAKIRANGPPKKNLMFQDPVKYQRDHELFIMASKYILSRSVLNFYYIPSELKSPKIPDTLEKEGGWITHEAVANKKLFEMSPKFVALFTNILKNFDSKHVVFSYFKEKSGVILIRSLLLLCGIETRLFTGDIGDDERRNILDEFNSEENRYGKNIKALLLTDAGVEGITILEAEHVHLLESSPTPNKTLQAIGRSIRYRSHYNMPPERQKVNVWKYQMVSSIIPGYKPAELNNFEEYYQYLIVDGMKNKKPKGESTVDISLDSIGKNKLDMFNDFYTTLQKYSIERGNVGIQIPITKVDQSEVQPQNKPISVIQEENEIEEESRDYFPDSILKVLEYIRIEYLNKFDQEHGGLINLNTYEVFDNAKRDPDNPYIIYWDSDTVKLINSNYCLWHTHPGGSIGGGGRKAEFEPPSGFDLRSCFEIGIEISFPVEGYIVSKRGYWFYKFNYTRELKDSKFNTDESKKQLEFLGNALAFCLNAKNENEIRDSYHPDDIKDYNLHPLSVSEYLNEINTRLKKYFIISFNEMQKKVLPEEDLFKEYKERFQEEDEEDDDEEVKPLDEDEEMLREYEEQFGSEKEDEDDEEEGEVLDEDETEEERMIREYEEQFGSEDED